MTRNPLLASLAFVCVGVSCAGSADETPVVELDPLTITTTFTYKPVETGWQYAEVPGFRLFCHATRPVKSIAERLETVRRGLISLWQLTPPPMTVVICAGEDEFLQWSGVSGEDVDRKTRVVRTAVGPVLLVNAQDETIDRAVGRSYTLAALANVGLPRWLNEGLAQIVNTVEIEGDQLTVGKIRINEMSLMDLHGLRELQQAAGDVPVQERSTMPARVSGRSRIADLAGGGFRAGAFFSGEEDGIPITLNGFHATWQQVLDYCDAELARRERARFTYQPDEDFFGYFRNVPIPDLEKLFDPGTPDGVTWRMAAWAFTHYSLFAGEKTQQPQLMKFVQILRERPTATPVQAFREAYQATPEKFEMALRGYAETARYQVPVFKLPEKFVPAAVALQDLKESPALQLKAAVLVATDRADAARRLLARGFAGRENRTPGYVRQYAELEYSFDRERTAKILETSAGQGALDPRAQRLLGKVRLERFERERGAEKMDQQVLASVLQPLFAALNANDQSEELFVLIGRAWTRSAVPPREEHLNAVRWSRWRAPRVR